MTTSVSQDWRDTVSPMPHLPAATHRPFVETVEPPGPVAAVALLLHGGKANGTGVPKNMSLSMLRMRPFKKQIAASGRTHGVAAWLLHYRVPGWNGTAADPARDAHWALAEIRQQYGEVPVVLVGHSMGGRAALRVADDASVVGVCALAPWLPPQEPMPQLVGRSVLMAHGTRDRWVDPRGSYQYAVRAKLGHRQVARFEVHGVGHAMLRRASDWHAFTCNAALGMLGVEPLWPLITNAMHEELPAGLRVPLEVPRTRAATDR